MLKCLRGGLVIVATLLLLALTSANAFAATAHSSRSALSSSASIPASLPCQKEYEEGGYGYNSEDIPGGWADVYDYFHQIGCVTFFDHYQFDGNASTDVYNSNGDLYRGSSVSLNTAISFDGVDVSFSFPVGAGFTLQNGDAAVHNQTGSNASYYTYSNLDASVFSCFAIHQTDTIEVTTGNSHNQTAAEVSLSCG